MITNEPDLIFQLMEKIAQKHLNIPTLKIRNSDSLDFYDCGVIAIEAALREAFIYGSKINKTS